MDDAPKRRGRAVGWRKPGAKSREGKRLNVQLTEAQYSELVSRAKRLGLTLTDYVVRRCCEDPE